MIRYSMTSYNKNNIYQNKSTKREYVDGYSQCDFANDHDNIILTINYVIKHVTLLRYGHFFKYLFLFFILVLKINHLKKYKYF